MHQDREIRQESYLATKYEKARQDVGLFLYLNIGNILGFKQLNHLSMYVLTYKLLGILRIGDSLLFS